ncbi:MAG: DUF2334 domain-containing protein, partial [Planctomycetes bacterium]|nr:DUF2334 domain-containing protein [Planctomycetota bacterium]
QRVEKLLDKYKVKPIVAVIPDNKDKFLNIDGMDEKFWDRVRGWKKKGWSIALHGYQHLYTTHDRGIVPIGIRSEFAGLPFETQKEMIRKAWILMLNEDIRPELWVAPSHTFDHNTLKALYSETDIRIISDGIALNIFYDGTFYWIPQQLWHFRRLPFGKWTICLHPNTMEDKDFDLLEEAITLNRKAFNSLQNIKLIERRKNIMDKLFEQFFILRFNQKHKTRAEI